MRVDLQKAKIGRYLSAFLVMLICFVGAWIVLDLNFTKEPYAIIGIMLLVVVSIFVLTILFVSIKSFLNSFKTKYERGTLKGVKNFTRISMLILALLITSIWLYWSILSIQNGIVESNGDWLFALAYVTLTYFSGSGIVHILYIIMFASIMLWTLIGLNFEIVKNILFGYQYKVSY